MRLASATSSARGEQRDAADRAQVQAQRVEARLDGQVELGVRRRAPRARRSAASSRPTQLDALLLEVGVELGDLLARGLGLLERRGDALVASATPRSWPSASSGASSSVSAIADSPSVTDASACGPPSSAISNLMAPLPAGASPPRPRE